MKIVGVIVEYNPLHNGHVHHILQIKSKSKADLIVAVLSSSITMRGDLSLFDKFVKTKQALENKIDIVIELPMVLCMQKADIFAENAVLLLNYLGVNEIWIGSENNDINLYKKCYEAFKNNTDTIRQKQKLGLSYKEITDTIYSLPSNDLLGYSYYKAIIDNHLPILLYTIKRKNSNYLDKEPIDASITSALAIRNDLSLFDSYTPKYVSKDKNMILNENELFKYLKYKILSSNPLELKKIFFVDEGIENKLKEIIAFDTLNDFINYLTSKRYTSTRIKRMLMYILFNVTKEEMNQIQASSIHFVRILGYSSKGKEYLSKIKKDKVIYTNIKNGLSLSLDIELRVSKILDLIYHTNLFDKEQKAPILMN